MAIINHSFEPEGRFTPFNAGPDLGRVYTPIPRAVLTFDVLSSGLGAALNDQDEWSVKMELDGQFAYLLASGVQSISYGGAANLDFLRDVYQPNIRVVGILGMDPSINFFTMGSPIGADQEGTGVQPLQVSRVDVTAYNSYQVKPTSMPRMPILSTGPPSQVPTVETYWQRSTNTRDFSGASWGFVSHFEFFVYDREQAQTAGLHTAVPVQQ